MVPGVGVTDHGRVSPGFPRHGQTVRRVVTSSRPACGAAAAGVRAPDPVTAEHHRVEIQTDLADLRHGLGDLVRAGPGGRVGRGEVRVLDVGDIFRDRCPALIRLVDAAN